MASTGDVYRGVRTGNGVSVTVDGRPLPARCDLFNHSPTGFEWGYGGSGPAQLALAILADCLGDEAALECYQEFKWEHVSTWPFQGWKISADQIRRWYEDRILGRQPSTASRIG